MTYPKITIVISINAYNAALSDDASSVPNEMGWPHPAGIIERNVMYNLTRQQAGEMSSHLFTVRDLLNAAGDEYSRRQARSCDRAGRRIARMLAALSVAETTAQDTDENNAMRGAL